jgi:small subunit ribosomal protein S17
MYTRRRAQVGVVVGNKMQKTVIVAVEKHKRHPLYKKSMRRTQRYKAHDEKEHCALGDTVRILESRPLSREKRWRVVEILARHEVAEVAPREIDQTILERIAAESPPPAEAPPVAEPEKAKKPTRSRKAAAQETEAPPEAAAESEPEPPEAETVPEAVAEAEVAPEPEAEAEAAPETNEEDTQPDKE